MKYKVLHFYTVQCSAASGQCAHLAPRAWRRLVAVLGGNGQCAQTTVRPQGRCAADAGTADEAVNHWPRLPTGLPAHTHTGLQYCRPSRPTARLPCTKPGSTALPCLRGLNCQAFFFQKPKMVLLSPVNHNLRFSLKVQNYVISEDKFQFGPILEINKPNQCPSKFQL